MLFRSVSQSRYVLGTANTWYITLTAGKPIPILGKKAAKELAMSILQFGCEDGTCTTPSNVKRIVRGGIEYEIVSEEDAFLATRVVSKFLSIYGNPKRWVGVTSPLDYKNQTVNPQST